MGEYPALYWFYLVLAIIVSGCSLTYWVYKFLQWRQRRQRRRTRWERSRLELQERLALLREDHDELAAIAAEVSSELAVTSALWRPLHRRGLQGRLKELQARQLDLERELAQLEGSLIGADQGRPRLRAD